MTRAAMAGSARLFIALWPEAVVRSKIAAAIAGLELSGRVTAANKLHITLVFLGEVDATRRACIEQSLASIEARPFEFVLSQPVWHRRGAMVWLTAPEVPAALRDLVTQLRAMLVPCGYSPDLRPFRLHLTAARNVRRFKRGRVFAAISWRVSDFCLVASTLSSSGSEYSIVKRWRLSRALSEDNLPD